MSIQSIQNPLHRRPQVLLVDDSPSSLRTLGEILSPDHDVLVATTGQAALEIARAMEPLDLILLDVMMPGLDGHAVCRALKEDESARRVPIIFVTALMGPEAEARGFDMGAVDYITKPFSAPVVRARVRTHVSLKRRSDLLENLAFLDGLTGIANRRQLDEHLDREWRRLTRRSASISLLMIDIDHFKGLNDHYGHGYGDDCLRRVAGAIADVARRSGDLPARYGGEEFAVVLPDTGIDGALAVAEKIRRSVEDLGLPNVASRVADHVTVSVGVAGSIPRHRGTPQELVNAADRALYRAKSSGRNRVHGEPTEVANIDEP